VAGDSWQCHVCAVAFAKTLRTATELKISGRNAVDNFAQYIKRLRKGEMERTLAGILR